jgi:hypothetical protein
MNKRILSVILIMALCIGLIPIGNVQAKTFSIKDVGESDDAFDSIQEVLDQGWMSLTLGKFFPDKKVSRAEFAYILTKFNSQLKEAAAIKKVSFKDITIKDKYAKYIELQKSQITYYNTKSGKYFKPNNYLTREDALVSMVKSMGYDSDEAISGGVDSEVDLSDILEDANKVSSALKNIVTIGVTNELINLYEDGDVLYLYPKKSITRRELAQLLVKAMNEKDYGKTDATVDSTDGETPTIDNSLNEDSNSNDVPTSVNKDSVTNLPGIIRTYDGRELGYITVDIKGKSKIYYQQFIGDFSSGVYYGDSNGYYDDAFIVTIPSSLKVGDKIVIDSADKKNSTSNFIVRYTNSSNKEFMFGDTAGESYSRHTSSRMTLTVTSNDIKDGYFTGTMEGKLVTSDGEVVTFSKGILKLRLPDSDF